jgi:hypothetical protein
MGEINAQSMKANIGKRRKQRNIRLLFWNLTESAMMVPTNSARNASCERVATSPNAQTTAAMMIGRSLRVEYLIRVPKRGCTRIRAMVPVRAAE